MPRVALRFFFIAPGRLVTEFLANQGVEFETKTFSAQRLAQSIHVSGHEVAKTVLLLTGAGDHAIAVLPADRGVDLEKVAQVLGDGKVSIASEFDISQLFLDCELGVISPFGSRYGLPAVVDAMLAADEQIVFEGNTHHDAVRINFQDYCKVEQPLVVDIAVD